MLGLDGMLADVWHVKAFLHLRFGGHSGRNAAPSFPCTTWPSHAMQDALEECLDRIAAGQAPAMLRSAWEQHRGTLCRGVNWDRCACLGWEAGGS